MLQVDDTVAKYCWTELPDWMDAAINADSELITSVQQLSPEVLQKLFDTPNDFAEKHVPGYVKDIKHRLLSGSGFVLIRCGGSHTDQKLRAIYALYSLQIGTLNDRYGFFFDVVDQGLDYTKEAVPVSKTRAATGYHTDSTAKTYLPDAVGLLCLQPAATGGDSLLTNAADLYVHLQTAHPSVLPEMKKDVIRDVITPGTVNNVAAIHENAFPIFSWPNEGFTFRYMRFWIETAFQKTGQELPAQLLRGLNATDDFFQEKSNSIQFRMERGDILFINNRFICHNRTAFENDPATTEPRKMVRTWINF